MEADDLARFLARPHNGVLATLRRDGRPYTVPVWWLWEPDAAAPAFEAGRHRYPGGTVWLTGTTTRVWCRQLIVDPRVSLCIEATSPVNGHVGIDGHAEAWFADDHDIWPVSKRLAEKYVGRGDPGNDAAVEAFVANMRTEPRMLFRITPEVLRAIDMRVYRGKRADREGPEKPERPEKPAQS
jgi:PPOX class probable F420-dependent enzyme